MLSLEKFIDSKKYVKHYDVIGGPALVYDSGCYIELPESEPYLLIIGRESWSSTDLWSLERILYEKWYLQECV